nr:M14 metal carboxypeptidase 8 [Antheraea yamamai]
MDIMVEGPRIVQVAAMLQEKDIPYSVAIGDVGIIIEREHGIALPKFTKDSSTGYRHKMDWKNYHRLDVIYAFLDALAKEYPYLCSVHVIGRSVEGRDIKMLKISNGDPENSGVWLDGSIHSREWITAAVVTYIADKLVKHFQDQPESVTNKDWYILPVMNPDGYEYTHTHDRMWRKNRARYGECVGVDLNRNFGYGWGEKGEEGSSEDPGNIFYRGPKPFSEPETAAVQRVITDSPTTFKVFLSFHSYGEVIIFPWGYTEDPCPDYVELLEGGTAMAKAIHETNGHTYKVGSTKDLMYYACGTSTDWSYAVANIPYSYMLELRSKSHRFLLPKDEIVSTAVEVMNGVLRLMDFVDRRCRSTQSCTCPK